MIRKIIHIDEEKCNGCGLCATACHEGAIDIINGKAKLVRENFCDGFGDCLPGCPTGAITFEEREAPAYDEAAVQENKKEEGIAGEDGSTSTRAAAPAPGCGCWNSRRPPKACLLPLCSPFPACATGRCRSSWHPSTRPTLRAQSS